MSVLMLLRSMDIYASAERYNSNAISQTAIQKIFYSFQFLFTCRILIIALKAVWVQHAKPVTTCVDYYNLAINWKVNAYQRTAYCGAIVLPGFRATLATLVSHDCRGANQPQPPPSPINPRRSFSLKTPSNICRIVIRVQFRRRRLRKAASQLFAPLLSQPTGGHRHSFHSGLEYRSAVLPGRQQQLSAYCRYVIVRCSFLTGPITPTDFVISIFSPRQSITAN